MLLKSTQIVTPLGMVAGGLVLRNGLIERIIEDLDGFAGGEGVEEIVDVGDLFVLPGVIDGHVHVNQPGRTEWEGIESATKGAAAGGITTIVDMPLNSSPVTTTPEAWRAKVDSIAGKCWVDVGLHGGAVGTLASEENLGQLERNVESLLDVGVLGVKVFLCDSGLDEFPPVTERELDRIMPILAKRGSRLWVHAEKIPADWHSPDTIDRYRDWPTLRSRVFEANAIGELIRLCEKHECPTHIVHLANADAIAAIRRAKRQLLPLTVETCPHYLYFCAEQIPDRDPRYKCCPPIREIENRHRLWQALELGEIDTIGSDHSPCPPSMKNLDSGDFASAWGGIASLQLLLPVMWHQARVYEMPITRLVECLSSAPAKVLNLDRRMGSIEVGKEANLVVLDPEEEWTVRGTELYHRHSITPYEGVVLRGRVIRTYLRGRVVFEAGTVSPVPLGQLCGRE